MTDKPLKELLRTIAQKTHRGETEVEMARRLRKLDEHEKERYHALRSEGDAAGRGVRQESAYSRAAVWHTVRRILDGAADD